MAQEHLKEPMVLVQFPGGRGFGQLSVFLSHSSISYENIKKTDYTAFQKIVT